MKVGIVGVGLIGGSLALKMALGGVELFLDDSDPNTVEELKRQNIGTVEPWMNWCGQVDALVMAVPWERQLELMQKIAEKIRDETWLVEVGSIKSNLARNLTWAGPHARVASLHFMAGREVGGFGHASPTLFTGAPAAVVDIGWGYPPDDWLQWWNLILGVAPFTYWTAASHDEAMAWISQMPYLASRAVKVIVENQKPESLALSGPGFRDTTRVGQTHWEGMSPLLTDSSVELNRALLALEAQIEAWRQSLVLSQGQAKGVNGGDDGSNSPGQRH